MKMSNFQLVVTGIFAALIIIGMGVFATKGGGGSGSSIGQVVIWGTLDQSAMSGALDALRQSDKSYAGVSYVYKDPATYQNQLVDAMAAGRGPDLFFVSPETISTLADKIRVIPYSTVSQQTYTSSYIDEARLFLASQGPAALPILIDPLVMYSNRDALSGAGVAEPPKYWDELLTLAPQLTVVDSNAIVQKSAVALGGLSNISYAKEILATLVMQAGDPIVVPGGQSGQMVVFGQTPQGAGGNPAVSALQFYTNFSNPSKTSYSWNRSLPEAGDAFVSGKLALYFGFASDYQGLLLRNPNLHVGVAMLPQIKTGGVRLTYGRLTGVAIARTATNPTGALAIAELLSGQAGVGTIATALKLPPVRLDVAQDTSANAPLAVFDQSAIMARAWLDPNPAQTDDIFKSMIESVVTGASQPDKAVSDAAQALGILYRANSTQ